MNDEDAWLERQVMQALDPGEGLRTAYDQLRPTERAFVDEYVLVLDPKLAAKRLSVPQIGAGRQTSLARTYLTNPLVQAAIAEAMQARRERYAPTIERITQELSKIAFASLSDYMKIGVDGEPYYDFSGVSAEAMAAIAEITVEDFTQGRGEDARDVRRVKVKPHDKLRALEMLGKMLGAMPSDQSFNVTINNNSVNVSMTAQEAADAYAKTLDAD